MRLYRGIAVSKSSAALTIEAIQRDGLVIGAGWWNLAVHDLKTRLESLWRSPDLSTKLTRPESEEPIPRICACATHKDALYYACSHNKEKDREASILIAFDADPQDVIVDGRDFLYTVVQLGNPIASRDVLGQIFGPGVLRYADRAWQSTEQFTRIACCDLAIQDQDVVLAHAANRLVVGGRHKTRFLSAVMVRGPIAADRIVSVERVDCRGYVLPNIDIALDQALGR